MRLAGIFVFCIMGWACPGLDWQQANRCEQANDCLDGYRCCQGRCIAESEAVSQCADAQFNEFGFPIGKWQLIDFDIKPIARDYAYCAFDGVRYFYVFGGYNKGNNRGLDDLWQLDTQTWLWRQMWNNSMESTLKPTPRWAGSACVHDGVFYALGGVHPISAWDDFQIWSFNLGSTQWQLIVGTGSAYATKSNAFFSSGYDSNQAQLWLFGGQATTFDEDLTPFLYTFSPQNHELHNQVQSPQYNHWALQNHSMIVDNDDELHLVTFGGIEGKTYLNACNANDETWQFDTGIALWQRIGSDLDVAPPARSDSVFVRMSGHRVLLFAGRANNCNGGPMDDLWLFDTLSSQWSRLDPLESVRPPARAEACAAAIHGGNSLMVFGGASHEISLNDLWVFALPSETTQ